jgi:hypothetical protein
LENEIAELGRLTAECHHRNASLNRAAFNLFQLVAGGELPESGIIDHLVAACERNGLLADDGLYAVMATINSARRAGLQYPRARSRRWAP